MAKMTKAEKAEMEKAKEQLREMLPPGTKVLGCVKHVSRSGMMREISLYAVVDGELQWLSGLAARAMGERLGPREGIKVGGCGMDMVFHLIYSLSRTLYGDAPVHGREGLRPQRVPEQRSLQRSDGRTDERGGELRDDTHAPRRRLRAPLRPPVDPRLPGRVAPARGT